MEGATINILKQTAIEEVISDKQGVINLTTQEEARATADNYGVAYTKGQKLETIKKAIIKFLDKRIKEIEKSKLKTRSPEDITAEFDKEMGVAYKEIEVLRSNIDAKNGEIYSIDDAIKDSQEAMRLNEREEERIDRDNKAKLAMFAANLSVLNGGIMDLSRQPDESDEDYRQRLMASGKTIYDDKTAEDDENAIQLARAKNN